MSRTHHEQIAKDLRDLRRKLRDEPSAIDTEQAEVILQNAAYAIEENADTIRRIEYVIAPRPDEERRACNCAACQAAQAEGEEVRP